MAVNSGLFNSVNGDRKYNASWFAQYFASFIGNGVFPNPSTGLQVIESTNMQTVVKAGKGWINGYYIVNDANYILQHDVADGVLKRIDRVVMRLNFLTRTIEIVIKKGAFASSPTAPILQRDTDYHELALADVLIANGKTQITQANITDTRLNKALCGIVHGTVDQVDTTTIFNQYQSWFSTTTSNAETEINDWQGLMEQDFNAWFQSIQDILSGDVAANLANQIASLDDTVAAHLADYTSFLTDDYSPFKNSKGQANGLASLDADGKLKSNQLPKIDGTWEVIATATISSATSLVEFKDLNLGDYLFLKLIGEDLRSSSPSSSSTLTITVNNVSGGYMTSKNYVAATSKAFMIQQSTVPSTNTTTPGFDLTLTNITSGLFQAIQQDGSTNMSVVDGLVSNTIKVTNSIEVSGSLGSGKFLLLGVKR